MPLRRGTCSVLCAAFGLAGAVGAAIAATHSPVIEVVIGGDTQGYLAPCGCTSPMTGGISRLATAVTQYRGRDGIFLENGGLVEENPPNRLVGLEQGRLKAEAIADALGVLHVDAVNIGQEEVAGGRGMLSEIVELTHQTAVSTSLEPNPSNHLAPWIARGPLLIGGITPAAANLAFVTGETAVPAQTAAHRIVVEATARGLTPVLMFRGGQIEAASLATNEPGLALIVYRTAGTAPPGAIRVGRTLLVTPGDRTKNLIRLEFDGTTFSNYRTVTLTPDYADEPKVSDIYRHYLARVDRARLIEKLPRVGTAAFAGSWACASCHEAASRVWRNSAHFHALADLERQHHARDPDCLGCHVTGLSSSLGFRSRLRTPRLADVACEACHGPGKLHVLSPKAHRLPKVTSTTCYGCHNPDNSPDFSFVKFWQKISHR